MSKPTTIIAVVWVVTIVSGVFALITTQKPPEPKHCPKVQNDERLAYSTYHSDGRLECTYIPHGTYGSARRTI